MSKSSKKTINTLKVINKDKLSVMLGGNQAVMSLEQSAWSSLLNDNDSSDNFSSLFSDIEK